MKHVFISGVSGFIGSNLTKKLLNEGFQVTGIDNLSYGRIENIEDLKNHSHFKFIQSDVLHLDLKSIEKADTIVHLASQKIPRYTNSLRTLVENEQMTNIMTDLALQHNARLVFASTSDIYGKNPDLPYSETSNSVLGPTTIKRWAYAMSKLFSEHKIIAYSEDQNLKYTIVRFFGSYGKNQNLTWWGGPQSVFIDKALKNEEIELHGDGLQTRTFTYIEDTVEALSLSITKSEAENQIFNIASDQNEEISIKDLAHLIWQLVRNEDKPKIKFIPYETFGKYEDVRRRVPDISKIKSLLGFKPKYSLEEGLRITIDWQKSLS